MTKLFVIPLAASLLFGGTTALAQVAQTTEKPATEQVKPEHPRGEKPKETRKERCLRKHSGDESKCRKPTLRERCERKYGSWEKCLEIKKERHEKITQERREKRHQQNQ